MSRRTAAEVAAIEAERAQAYRQAVQDTVDALSPISQASRDELTLMLRKPKPPTVVRRPPSPRVQRERRLTAQYVTAGFEQPETPPAPAPIEIAWSDRGTAQEPSPVSSTGDVSPARRRAADELGTLTTTPTGRNP